MLLYKESQRKCCYIFSMVNFIDENINEDGLIVPPEKKKNPWADSRKCDIL